MATETEIYTRASYYSYECVLDAYSTCLQALHWPELLQQITDQGLTWTSLHHDSE